MVNDNEKRISDVLKQKRRELKRIQNEAEMKRAKRTVDAMIRKIGNSVSVCRSLRGFTAEEGEIIARHVIKHFDTIVDLSLNDIKNLQVKKLEKKLAYKKQELAKILGKQM